MYNTMNMCQVQLMRIIVTKHIMVKQNQNQLVPTVPHSLNRLWSLSAIYNALLFCLSFGVVSEVEEHQ